MIMHPTKCERCGEILIAERKVHSLLKFTISFHVDYMGSISQYYHICFIDGSENIYV